MNPSQGDGKVPVDDLPISALEGFDLVEGILASRPLAHFNRVHALRYFGRREEDRIHLHCRSISWFDPRRQV